MELSLILAKQMMVMCLLMAVGVWLLRIQTLFAELNGLDYTRAVKDVCVSTIFSVVTMPLIVSLATFVW